MSSSAAEASRPEVGSSRKRRDGSATSSMPMFTRFFWPPEMPRRATPPHTWCLYSERPSKSITRSAYASTWTLVRSLGSRCAAANHSCSLTVRASIMMSFCGTKPCSLRKCAGVHGTPPRTCRSLPDVGRSLPESRVISVVLPHPLGPMRAVTEPWRRLALTSVRTGVPLGSLNETSSTTRSMVSRWSCSAATACLKPSSIFSRPAWRVAAAPMPMRILVLNECWRRTSRTRAKKRLKKAHSANAPTRICSGVSMSAMTLGKAI
mmetsp:Transcript_78077/g.233998  ORF Transcript_78077/g.233998 Transcript_78077/m.233998 type:complete len:264 (+) Transcript_78077:152-943(+)